MKKSLIFSMILSLPITGSAECIKFIKKIEAENDGTVWIQKESGIWHPLAGQPEASLAEKAFILKLPVCLGIGHLSAKGEYYVVSNITLGGCVSEKDHDCDK